MKLVLLVVLVAVAAGEEGVPSPGIFGAEASADLVVEGAQHANLTEDQVKWCLGSQAQAHQFAAGEVVPIVVISYNKFRALRMLVSATQRLKDPHRVVIVDFKSTHAELYKYLDHLEASGAASVVRLPNSGMHRNQDVVNEFVMNGKLAALLAEHGETHKFYVATDPDIILAAAPDMLSFHATLLGACGISRVGPVLSLTDVPAHYPHRRVLLGWEGRFWPRPFSVRWKGVLNNVYDARIDTTWLMQKAGTSFKVKPLPWALRTGPPYAAHHLGWYLDPKRKTPEEVRYGKTSATNWDGERGPSGWVHGHAETWLRIGKVEWMNLK